MTREELKKLLMENAYTNDKSRDFYQDLLSAFGLKESNLTARMYSLAWENGHAYGYHEVYCHFSDLVRVFKDE